MAGYRTEEEQIEQLKEWFRKNGATTIIAVVLVVAAYFGGQAYRQSNLTKTQQATDEYAMLLDELQQKDKRKQAKQHGKDIMEKYADSVQALNTALLLAKMAVEDEQLSEAVGLLRMVSRQAKLRSIRIIARVRLARVLNELGKYSDALKALENDEAGKLMPLFEEVKGDIFVAQGKIAKARAAYARSLQIDPASIRQTILRMKLEDLPVADKSANAS